MAQKFDIGLNAKINEFAKKFSIIRTDKNDDDVSVKAAYNIHGNLKNNTLLITEGLGHRKILGDSEVLKSIKEFIRNYF